MGDHGELEPQESVHRLACRQVGMLAIRLAGPWQHQGPQVLPLPQVLPPAPSSSLCAVQSPCRLEYWQGQVSGGVALSWSAWGLRGSTPTWGSLIDKQIVPAASLYTIGDT